MNIRQRLLLKMMIKLKRETVEKFAQIFACSERTIRNDLEEIMQYTQNTLHKHCIFLHNGHISLVLDDKDEVLLRKDDHYMDYYLYKLSAEERKMLILFELLLSNEKITIQYISEKLCVSRGTINSDLIVIKQWCETYQLNFTTQKGKGLMIKEDEPTRRRFMSKLLKEYKGLINREVHACSYLDVYQNLFQNADLRTIQMIILDAEDAFHYVLSDIAFEALMIHIALALERNVTYPNTIKNQIFDELYQEREEFTMAEYIVKELQQREHVILPKDEVYYIMLHIYGKSNASPDNKEDDWLYIQMLAAEFILQVGIEMHINFKEDERLYVGLTKHISAAIFRFKHHLVLENPLKESLLEAYYDVYDAVKHQIHIFKRYVKTEISEDELAYIVLHFASAKERVTTDALPDVRVAIVCSTGFGTAQLVVTRLVKYFNFRVEYIVGQHQLAKQWQRYPVDLIISTIPLSAQYPWVLVSALLKEKDIEHIHHQLFILGLQQRYLKQMVPFPSRSAKQLETIIRKHATIEDEEVLLQEVHKWMHGVRKDEAQLHVEGKKILMLSDVLKEAYMQLDLHVHDWEDAIRKTGIVLESKGIITSAYVEATIQNVKELGPYIVITKGVALPHANSEQGVLETAISFARLKEPVCFGNPDNDPVRYIFMLAPKDANSHLRALSDLVALLGEQAFFEVMDQAQDTNDIMRYIKAYELR